MKKAFLSVLTICILSFISVNDMHARLLVEDFDDGNFDGWEVVQDPNAPDCIPNWFVDNGILKIDIDNGPCSVNLVPSDELWGDIGKDYVVEFDGWFIDGADHNIAFRFTRGEVFNPMHEYHIVGGGGILGWAPISNVPNNYFYATPNRLEPYHFKLNVKTGHFEFFIDGQKVHDYPYPVENEKRPVGKFAFRAGAGAVTHSENWFDNLVIRKFPTTLDVKHFSQRDPLWKDDEYDNASASNDLGWREIEEWGCAMTSAAMVLDYHGITKGPDGQVTNPQSLNQYLIDKGGFNQKGGVVWSYVTTYANEATKSGHLDPGVKALEFKYDNFDLDSYEQDIENGLPSILKIVTNNKNNVDPQDDNLHFVVGKGFDGDEVLINDPWDLLDTGALLNDNYENKVVRQVGRMVPTNTDLSYIWIYQYNPNVETVLEHNESKTGEAAGVLYQEIARSLYQEDGLISVPDQFERRFGEPDSWQGELVVAKPDSGQYRLNFSANSPELAEYEVHVFDKDGNVKKYIGTVMVGGKTEFVLNLDKESAENNQFVQVVDFDQLIADVRFAYAQNWINRRGMKNSLIAFVRLAKMFYPRRMRIVERRLDQFENHLDRHKNRLINQEGYDFLMGRLELLRLNIM